MTAPGVTGTALLLEDVRAFADAIGRPMTDWQAAAVTDAHPVVVVRSPRRMGKTRTIATYVLWRCFREPGHQALVISAREDSARDVLAEVAAACRHPLLGASVASDQVTTLTLTNGSAIRVLPASVKAPRGKAAGTLCLDEAAFIPDQVINAALPTTWAEGADVKVLVSSTPWVPAGAYFRLHQEGLGVSPLVGTHGWRRRDADWISTEQVELLRLSAVSELDFAAEAEGEFTGASDRFLDPDDLREAVADYTLLDPSEARGEAGALGVDWGMRRDATAVVIAAVLDDHGENDLPLIFLPYLFTTREPYKEQTERIARLALPGQSVLPGGPVAGAGAVQAMGNGWFLHLSGRTVRPQPPAKPHGFALQAAICERNGVGEFPSAEVARLLPRVPVVARHTTTASKEDGYALLRGLLQGRQLVLPNDRQMLAQLGGLVAEPLQSGQVRIRAEVESVHDDIPDAIVFALEALLGGATRERTDSALQQRRVHTVPMYAGAVTPAPAGCDWLTTPSGLRVPARPRPRKGGPLTERNTLRRTSYPL